MKYRVILKSLIRQGEVIVLVDGCASLAFAEDMRKNWRKVLGGKNWTVDRRPGLDTIDSNLALTVERYGL